MPRAAQPRLSLYVTGAQLALLKKHDFPCSQDVLASARETEEGIELSGSWLDFDSLAGWVAGEANYARRNRRPRQTELLDDIADQLESALASSPR
jgi:hypothetical protein